MRVRHGLFAAAVLVGSLSIGSARAGLLAPGETGSSRPIGGSDSPFLMRVPYPDLDGEVLEERSTPFEHFAPGDETSGEGDYVVRGAFTERVVRDAATGRITFYYDLTTTEGGGSTQAEDAVIRSFGGFETDVFVTLPSIDLNRSTDGEVFDYDFSDTLFDIGFVVRTDATGYEEGGEFTFEAGDAFGDASFGGRYDTFQPAVADGGGNPTPNPVPLPAAAWTGLTTLAGLGLAGRARPRHPRTKQTPATRPGLFVAAHAAAGGFR